MTTTWTPAPSASGTWTVAPQASGSWAQVSLPQPQLVDGVTWVDGTWTDGFWDPVTMDAWTETA